MSGTPAPDSPRDLVPLRHTLATLAYRAGKALRDAPEGFADCRLAPATRTYSVANEELRLSLTNDPLGETYNVVVTGLGSTDL